MAWRIRLFSSFISHPSISSSLLVNTDCVAYFGLWHFQTFQSLYPLHLANSLLSWLERTELGFYITGQQLEAVWCGLEDYKFLGYTLPNSPSSTTFTYYVIHTTSQQFETVDVAWWILTINIALRWNSLRPPTPLTANLRVWTTSQQLEVVWCGMVEQIYLLCFLFDHDFQYCFRDI